jgi:ABC-type multidrug transport system permease subunit
MSAGLGLNICGIISQITGFILLLFAVKQMPLKGGGFTSPVDYLGNVMSTRHPRVNFIGIIFVILGLVFQLVALFLLRLVLGTNNSLLYSLLCHSLN